LPENWPIYPDPHSSPPLYLVIRGWPHDGGLPTRFRTEPDFIDNSEFVISSIFKELKIDDIKGAVLTEVVNENVVGDVHFSRGNRSDKLVKLKRRYASFLKRRRILLNEKLKEANQIMKYSNSYYSKELEGLFEYLIYILNARSEFLIRIIKRCFSKYRI